MEHKQNKKLYLREAVSSDCDLLFFWCNDPQCRKNSFRAERIPYEEHCRWFSEKMVSNDCYIFICMQGEDAIGQVRLDVEGKKAKISYSLDAAHRGCGMGYQMLLLLEELVPQRVDTLYALVKEQNVASQKCFEKLGYRKSLEDGFFIYQKAGHFM